MHCLCDFSSFISAPDRSLEEQLAMSPLEELEQRFHEVEFGAATCALTILRFMTDAVSSLPISVMARLVSTHDTIMALVPLVDKPPWVRTRKGKVRAVKARGQALSMVNKQ
jgi:hypothetical protein